MIATELLQRLETGPLGPRFPKDALDELRAPWFNASGPALFSAVSDLVKLYLAIDGQHAGCEAVEQLARVIAELSERLDAQALEDLASTSSQAAAALQQARKLAEAQSEGAAARVGKRPDSAAGMALGKQKKKARPDDL